MPRKKAVQPPVAVTVVNEIVSLDQPPPALPAPEAKPKRQKKSKHEIVAVVTDNGIQGTFQPDSKRPLIAHLPIHSNDIKFLDQPIQYDPNPPCQPVAFNQGDIDPFANEATYENLGGLVPQQQEEPKKAARSEDSDHEVVQPPVRQVQPVSQQRKEYGPTTLLVQYADSKKTQELPTETTVGCFWCCDAFEGRPCVIPLRINDSVWQVYGNFCTPQCSMAYLLSEVLDTHTRWERIGLLNRLYAESVNGRIYPAPAREVLSKFGGPMSVAEFRSICDSQRVRVDIHMPPMVSILASMDTKPIDFYETPLRNTFASPYQMARNTQSDEPTGLKLKRNKPLKDKESTLDTCLQYLK